MSLATQCRALTIEIPQKEPLQSHKSRDHENDFEFPEEENQHDDQAITMDVEICEDLKIFLKSQHSNTFQCTS